MSLFDRGEFQAEQAYQEFLRRKKVSTKVVTGKVRFSYVNIFRSRAFHEGQDAKYSICLLIPKSDKATDRKSVV